MESPKTLLETIKFFSDYENCRKFMEFVRWPDGKIKCPRCNSEKVTYLEKARVYRCYGDHPKQKFSLKVGTVFEDSAIPLEKWLPATWMLSNDKNGISSYELSRALGVTQKSAWFMLHRIRTAMKKIACRTSWAADLTPKSKLTRLSSAVRNATCTRTRNSAMKSAGAHPAKQ